MPHRPGSPLAVSALLLAFVAACGGGAAQQDAGGPSDQPAAPSLPTQPPSATAERTWPTSDELAASITGYTLSTSPRLEQEIPDEFPDPARPRTLRELLRDGKIVGFVDISELEAELDEAAEADLLEAAALGLERERPSEIALGPVRAVQGELVDGEKQLGFAYFRYIVIVRATPDVVDDVGMQLAEAVVAAAAKS